jgi:hypothetical protein
LNVRGAEPQAIAELVRYARELLDIIEDEIADSAPDTVADARVALVQLRGRLESLERDISTDEALTPINPAGLLPA